MVLGLVEKRAGEWLDGSRGKRELGRRGDIVGNDLRGSGSLICISKRVTLYIKQGTLKC